MAEAAGWRRKNQCAASLGVDFSGTADVPSAILSRFILQYQR
jgi:hypothetical protein